MLATRIIPCLDVDEGRVVKCIRFKNLQEVGDPEEMAGFYEKEGADELAFLDIGASYKSREIMIDVVRRVSRRVFIPLTVGGGLRSIADMRAVLNAGADKVAICTSAIENPSLIGEGARNFGSQCIVLSIDAKRFRKGWHAFTHGGRLDSGIDAVDWARRGERLGAGEILLNSMDRDGTRAGYDLELTRRVSEEVGIPVIASGGAGNLCQMLDAVILGKADAILVASLLHYGECSIRQIKDFFRKKEVCVR